MAGEFRYIPQDTLNDVANLVNPILDAIVPFVPYVAVMVLLGGIPRALLQLKLDGMKGPWLSKEMDLRLRSVPLSIGVWGLLTMHLCFFFMPGVAQKFASSAGMRGLIEVMMMGFGFFTLFALLNIVVRYVLDADIRKKLGKLGLLDMAIIATVIQPVLGLALYTWATVRWASVWTGTVMWQSWIDAFTFNFDNHGVIEQMPVLAKLYMIAIPIGAAHLLFSRLLTHLSIPRPSIWLRGLGGPIGASKEDAADVAAMAALAYGITPESKALDNEGESEEA